MQPHDRRVEPPEVPGHRSEQHADRQPDGDCDDADEERVARAIDEPRELVPSEVVDAQQVLARRAWAAPVLDQFEVLLLRVVWRKQRSEDGDEDEEADDEDAEYRSRVPHRSADRVPHEPGRRVLLE